MRSEERLNVARRGLSKLGWHSSLNSSVTTEAGGLSAGVGVVSAWALGIRCIDAVKNFDDCPRKLSQHVLEGYRRGTSWI